MRVKDPTSNGPARQIRASATLVVLVLAIATLPFAFHLQYRVEKKLRAQQERQINDFERWMVIVPRYLHERIDFVTDSFPNPPVVLLVLAPLTTLPPARAQLVWACLKSILAIAIVLLCLGMVRRAGVEPTMPAIALTLGVWLWPVVGDIQAGQTNLVMLLPLVAGLSVVQVERRIGDWLGGFLIGLAVCIKVTPLAFLPYAVFRRRGRVVGGILVGLVAWLFVVPALAFGWQQNLRWLGQYYRIMVEPYVVHGQVKYIVGQSIPSLVSRLLRHVPAFASGGPDEYYVNVVDLPEPVVAWIIRGVLLAIAVAGVTWAWRPPPTLRSRRYVAEIGCVAAFMLWASQRTWVEHFVTLVLPAFAVAMIGSDPGESPRSRRRARWALLAALGLLALTSDIGKLFGPHGADYVRTIGVAFWASVFLVLVIVTARLAPEGGCAR